MAESMPSGLSRLHSLSAVHVRQKTTLFTDNKYVVMAPGGEVVLYAREDSGVLDKVFGGKDRAFEIDILDRQDREVRAQVIRLRRPYTFGPDKMDVAVCGRLVAVVRQEMTFLKPVLSINDARDQQLLRVKGPMSTTGDADFKLFNTSKQQVGVISKRWGGFSRELFTDSDNYQICFPGGASVELKAAVIATCFLIDFLYYEN